jgi:hypothetical protein
MIPTIPKIVNCFFAKKDTKFWLKKTDILDNSGLFSSNNVAKKIDE